MPELVKKLGLPLRNRGVVAVNAAGQVVQYGKRDANGNVPQTILAQVTREDGWQYYINRKGDVVRTPAQR